MGVAAEINSSILIHPQALVESSKIGPRTRIWAFVHVLPGAQVGSDCNLGDHVFVESGAVVGDNVTVKNGVALWDGITVERNVFIGPNCVFTNDGNPRAFIKKPAEKLAATRVCEGATLGANATILCGTTIGRYAFVGAGAVVLRDVPDYALVVGNPARQAGWMCECANQLSLSVTAAEGASDKCMRCGNSYVRISKGLALA